MKTLVLYGTNHNSTKRVVEKIKDHLKFTYDIINVKDVDDISIILNYELLLFFVPTYGDEELQDDMENFIIKCKLDLSEKYFAVCELGNYYGYDDFIFGAMPIIYKSLVALKAKPFLTPLSLDSLPKKDWALLEKWCYKLNSKYFDHICQT